MAPREARQRTLDDRYATFERLGELNEGLAEYALVRILMLAGSDSSNAALDSLTRDRTRSIRLRFYATGGWRSGCQDRKPGRDPKRLTRI